MPVDLDKARAARREARGDGPVVVFGGEEFVFPAELPMTVVAMMTQDITPVVMLDVLREFLGDRYDAFMANQPSPDDISELIQGIMKEYGLAPGESAASES